MKKSIIAASAASVALAAMPVVGVFAVGTTDNVDSHTDAFQFTIEDTCTFARAATAHGTSETGSWVTGNDDDTDAENGGNGVLAGTDKFTLTTAAAGNTYAMGDSSFVVKCNYTGGYDINVVASVLSNGTAADDIPVGEAAVGTTSSTWTISRTVEGTPTYYGTTGNTKVFSNSRPNDISAGESFTMNYNVGLKATQSSGTYAGTAVYTLTSPAQS